MTSLAFLVSKKSDIESLAGYFGLGNLKVCRFGEAGSAALLVSPTSPEFSENVSMFEVYLHAQFSLSLPVYDETEGDDPEFVESFQKAVKLDDVGGLHTLWEIGDLSHVEIQSDSQTGGALYDVLLAQAREYMSSLGSQSDDAAVGAARVGGDFLSFAGGGAFTPATVERKPTVQVGQGNAEVIVAIPVPKSKRARGLFSNIESLSGFGDACAELLSARLDADAPDPEDVGDSMSRSP
jgi:hypothetical protein